MLKSPYIKLYLQYFKRERKDKRFKRYKMNVTNSIPEYDYECFSNFQELVHFL